MLVSQIQMRVDAISMATDTARKMLKEFLHLVDMDEYAQEMNFVDSYITLHDHQLGDEIIKQTDLMEKFKDFAGAGKFEELFGGEDENLSGKAMEHFSNHFSKVMESIFRAEDFRPLMARTLSQKMKSSEWWKNNGDEVSKTLQKNRDRLNKVKAVQLS